ITESDIEAVAEVLRSTWITQGPKIQEFEERVAALCGAKYGVAFSSGTAALHAACVAAGIGPGDEVITSPLTFVATANAAAYQGGIPVFADIDSRTLTIDPGEIARRLTPKTKAIIPVHFAGLPCAMAPIADLARRKGLTVIEDACHAFGAEWRSPDGTMQRIGNCSHSDMAVFSFHPVKHITTGEGGMVLTNRKDLVSTLRAFRHHGIVRAEEIDPAPEEPWAYQMQFLGYNYRITDFQCALGLKQLARLDDSLRRRREIAMRYREACDRLGLISQDGDGPDRRHAWHLYVVQLPLERLAAGRKEVFKALRDAGLPVNVHYAPVYLHPFYRERFGYRPGLCPKAERYYHTAITLPLSPRMAPDDVERTVEIVQEVLVSLCAQ
ncbi:MAG: UDP-4-amino-4,6-dideoxy-N-acetyl-beta-L-altrosamine transaminase, partial [Candidatus Omnitrophota bacterium]|nr:UDP-4-amino-4,6-dideoxy-N-acetyl-beta-L-altrosamine transaminase [Candidatus Omnitrophota bacterium]